MKRMETPDKANLARITDEIGRGSYVIPDFQREFDWRPWDVVDLLKSIFKDYYIGTLLLWRADKENIKHLSCESIYGSDKSISLAQHIVLDGQQRLSALHYALFAPQKHYPNRTSRCFFFLKIEEFLNGNIEDAIYYDWDSRKVSEFRKNRKLQYEAKEIPLTVLADEDFEYRDWLDEYEEFYAEKGVDVKKEKSILKKDLKDLLNNYEISYIELDRDIEIAKVCDIFTKINSTGINLSIFDLLNAVLKPKDIQLKQMWRSVKDDFSEVLEAKGVLATMSILKQTYCAPSFLYYLVPGVRKTIKSKSGDKKEIVLIENKDAFIEMWNSVIDELKIALQIIQSPNEYGAIDIRFMPYKSIIPIFAVLNAEKKKEKYADKHIITKKISQWYWSSIIGKNYSSASESQMAKDYQEMLKWFSDDDNTPTVIRHSITEIDSLRLSEERSNRSAVYIAVFNIIIINGAQDWVSAAKPEYSDLDDHHIVPKSWGEKNVGKDKINTILNRTVISDVTNRKIIGNQLPNIYLKKMLEDVGDKESFYKILESHLISRKAVEILLRENFSKEDYEEFIQEREKTILYELRKKIGSVSNLEKNLEESPNEALNIFEINMRNFIDDRLTLSCGGDYWKQYIPGNEKKAIEQNIKKEQVTNPSKSFEANRKKLDFCDMSHYENIIIQNWSIFEDNFQNKENLRMHFSNIRNYRNTEKHARGRDESLQELGGASIKWMMNIISSK